MTTIDGNHRIETTSRRAAQLSDLLTAKLTPTGRRSLRALSAHGASLCAVTRMITPDEDLGERLVVRAVVSCCRAGADPDLKDLSAYVITQWVSGAMHSSHRRDASVVPTPLLLDVHRLPEQQRALLAVCKFGGHTYREAAELLDVTAEAAALLLGEALRTLGDVPRP